MKLNKDSVLKMGDHKFKFEDIETINIAGGCLSMKGMGKYGMRIQAEIQLKGVEFLNPAKEPAIETRTWTIFDGATRYSPRLWETNTEKSFFDSIREQIENDNDVMGAVRRAAVREAMKEAERERMRKGTTLSGGD